MASTSNDRIMTEYLVSYGASKASPTPSRDRLLEILHVADAYRAGGEVAKARSSYDPAQWDGVPAVELDRRLADLDRFMKGLARDRLQMWGVAAAAS